MAMDSYMNGVTQDYDKATQPVQKADSAVKTAPKAAVTKGDSNAQDGTVTSQEFIDEILNKNASKEPTRGTIDSAISDMNAKMSKTRCAYAYDDVAVKRSFAPCIMILFFPENQHYTLNRRSSNKTFSKDKH